MVVQCTLPYSELAPCDFLVERISPAVRFEIRPGVEY